MATKATGDQESVGGEKGAKWSRGYYMARRALIVGGSACLKGRQVARKALMSDARRAPGE